MPVQAQRENGDTIDLVEIFYLLLSRLWQIIVMAILGGAIAFAISYFFITPQYRTTAKIYIVNPSNSVVDLTDLQLGSQLTADYRELLQGRLLLEDISKNLNLGMSASQLAGKISITNSNDTRILKITVTDTDPKRAADIANELVRLAGIHLPQIMGVEAPYVVEDALVPGARFTPSYSKNTVMGALALAVVYCGIVVIKHLMNDSLVTPDDVERYFGVKPLAAIPECELNWGDYKKKEKSKKKAVRV